MGRDREESDIEALRLAREESRETLNHQITLLNDIDDKAIRTARIAIILIALVISIAQFLPQQRLESIGRDTQLLVGLAGLLLSFTALVGIAIFNSSDPPFGIGSTHRKEIQREAYSEREWLVLMLEEYDAWTEEIRALNSNNAAWLGRIQLAFAIGFVYLFISAITIFTPVSARFSLIATGVGGVVLLLWSISTRVRKND